MTLKPGSVITEGHHITILKMAVVRHLEFSKFGILAIDIGEVLPKFIIFAVFMSYFAVISCT